MGRTLFQNQKTQGTVTDKFRIRILASTEAYLPPKHDPKKRGNTGSDKKWFGKTTFSRPHYEENHLFYKCESCKAMTEKEKMKFVESQKLSFNCLKRDHRAEKCPSKNRCLHSECAETHHTSLHDYFKKKVESTTAVEDAKVCLSKLPQVQNICLHIVPIKVRATNGEYILTYTVLDIGRKNTLILSDFAKRLNLRKKPKIVNISNIKDSAEMLNVDDVKLYVIDEENTSSFHINIVLAIKRERFNTPAQFLPFHFQKNGE